MSRTVPPKRHGRILRNGFSLLELSLVLVVIGTITALGITFGVSMVESAQRTATNNVLDAIEDALYSFRVANNRLPCPADVTLASTNANYGVEASTGGDCYSSGAVKANYQYLVPKGASTLTPGGTYIVEGGVPTAALGLPNTFQVDGWGRKIVYSVWVPLTGASAFTVYGITQNCGAIKVNDAAGHNRSIAGDYALVSFGPDGHGGYNSAGTRYSSGSTNTDAQANCHCTNAAVDNGSYAATYVQKEPTVNPAVSTDVFNGLVRYKERWQLANMGDDFSPSGQPCAAGFRIDGPAAGAGTGYADYTSIAIGDVNGDGLPDLIVGSYGTSEVDVIFGTKQGFPDPLPLANSTYLNGTNGSRLTAFYPGIMGWTGSSVAVGDIAGHNNGTVDIVIGTSHYDGYVFVYYGHSGTWASSYQLNTYSGTTGYINGQTGVRFDAPAASGENLGDVVAVGDVNGDDKNDIIMSAPLLANGGAVYVVFGNGTPTILPAPLVSTNGTSSVTPTTAGAYAGLMVGETVYLPNVTGSPTIASCNGGVSTVGTICTSGNPVVLDTSVPAVPSETMHVASVVVTPSYINGLNGVEYDASAWTGLNRGLGWGLAVGDVNDDGKADILMGDPMMNAQNGALYLVFGANPLLPTKTIDTTNGSNSITVHPDATGLIVGQRLRSANIPAVSQIATIVGTTVTLVQSDGVTASNATATASGTSMNVASVILNSTFLNGTNGSEFDGINASTLYRFPSSIAIGDVNGDGINDIVTSTDEQGTYVIFGHTALQRPWPSSSQPMTVGAGQFIDGTNGFRISKDYQLMAESVTVGDVNGDGIADILIGSTEANGYAGCAMLIFGYANPWPASILPSAAWLNGVNGVEFDGATAWDKAGGTSLAIGDINGDGISDLMIGAGNASYSFPTSGSVYVYFGRKKGWPTSPYNLGNL